LGISPATFHPFKKRINLEIAFFISSIYPIPTFLQRGGIP